MHAYLIFSGLASNYLISTESIRSLRKITSTNIRLRCVIRLGNAPALCNGQVSSAELIGSNDLRLTDLCILLKWFRYTIVETDKHMESVEKGVTC